MPTKNRHGKPWRVYQKRSGKMYYLGTYDTREEAVAAEKEFAKIHPPQPKGWGPTASKKSAEAKRTNAEIRRRERERPRWKKPEPMPAGDTPEVRQERARLRAVASIRD